MSTASIRTVFRKLSVIDGFKNSNDNAGTDLYYICAVVQYIHGYTDRQHNFSQWNYTLFKIIVGIGYKCNPYCALILWVGGNSEKVFHMELDL